MQFGNNWLLWAQSYSLHIHFFKIVKIEPIFFQNNAVSQDSWKRQLELNIFFSISAYEGKELVV